MSRVLAQAAWTIFAVAVGAAAVTAGWVTLIAVALLLGAGAAASQSRWLQQRVPLLRTHKQRLANFYDSGYSLWQEFTRQRKDKALEPWDEWREKVRKWDEPFWAYMKNARDDWRPLKRSVRSAPDKAYANLDEVVMGALDDRLALIKRLLSE